MAEFYHITIILQGQYITSDYIGSTTKTLSGIIIIATKIIF